MSETHTISAAFPYPSHYVKVHGLNMHYKDEGLGDPILFLHGNPTSSYLWRNIIPYLQGAGRCIAPDLIGMGESEKLPESGPGSYTFQEHRRYLDALLALLLVEGNVTLVVHDWGSALGFDWANRHRDAVKGIAYMEALVQPLIWDQWPSRSRAAFQQLRSEAGEQMILEENRFVEGMQGSSLRHLTDAEMEAYRRPYLQPGEGRRPTLTWPRQLPIAGEPADVVEIVRSYGQWLASSQIPKLFVNAEPGSILVGSQREFCRSWPNQREVTARGRHYLQEDSPDQIGEALANWYASLVREA
jgi:haloalkane dehalogenase